MFKKSDISAVLEKTITEKVTVKRKAVEVHFSNGKEPVTIRLEDGKQITDFIKLDDLNG